jgi:hypothetical protein
MSDYPKLPEEQYRKLVGQLRLQVGEALHGLRLYGQSEYVDGAIDEVVELAETFSMATRGKKTPIKLKNRRNYRERE